MSPTKPVVIAGILLGYEAFLTKKGLDPLALFAAAGLRIDDCANPQSELPLANVVYLLESAAAAARDPCLALDWAEDYPIGGMGPLFYLFLNSRTVGESLRTIAEHAPLLRHAVSVHFEQDVSGARIWWQWQKEFEGPYTQYGAFAFALLVTRIRLILGPAWTPLSVEMQGEPLTCTERATRLFGRSIKYESRQNRMVIDAASARTPIVQADPQLLEMLQSLGRRKMGEAPSGNFAGQARQAITRLLVARRATLDETARVLGCSPRTLQSRLTQQSTSFETLLNEVRKGRAEELVLDTDRKLSDIATELGFSELSAFSRAFGRWFGMSPSALRKQGRKGTR